MTPHEDPHSLGNLLLQRRRVTPMQLSEGVLHARTTGMKLGQALEDLGHIDEADWMPLVMLQPGLRANSPAEAAAHTHSLIAYGNDRMRAVAQCLDDLAERAEAGMRNLRSRRATVKP